MLYFADVRNSTCVFSSSNMEGKIDNLARVLDKVVNDISAIKHTVSVHENFIRSGQVNGSQLGSEDLGDIQEEPARTVYDRVNDTYRLGEMSPCFLHILAP